MINLIGLILIVLVHWILQAAGGGLINLIGLILIVLAVIFIIKQFNKKDNTKDENKKHKPFKFD